MDVQILHMVICFIVFLFMYAEHKGKLERLILPLNTNIYARVFISIILLPMTINTSSWAILCILYKKYR